MADDQLPQICDLLDKFPINEFLKMDLTQIYCIVNKNKIYSYTVVWTFVVNFFALRKNL
jgi:hypothetical protein